MKLSLLIFSALVLFSINCTKSPILSLTSSKKQIIAFVPLGNYSTLEINSVVNEVAHFYNKQVIILDVVNIPNRFFNPTIQQYSADSLIMLLSKLQNDTIIEIIGLTHKPLFTIKAAKPLPYFDENIFGMAYQPGNACIVSDFKFRTIDIKTFNHRLRNVIAHEVGHNLDLSHCREQNCIMSERWEYQILDKSEINYCNKCLNKLYR